MGREDGDLSLKLKDGPVDEGFFEEEGGVVGGEASREIVRAIKDDLVGREELKRVFGGEAARMGDDFDVRIDRLQPLSGAYQLGGTDRVGVVQDLPVEIGVGHRVGIDESDGAHARRSQVEQGGGAEASASDAEDGTRFEPLLTGLSELGEHCLSQVAVGFLRGQRHGRNLSRSRRRGKERLMPPGPGDTFPGVRVAIVAHPRKPDAPMAVRSVRQSLAARGIEVVLEDETARLIDESGEEAFADRADLVISLGGDGTLLETLHRIGPAAAPIAGVNIGTLGFLTACTDEEIDQLSDHLARGEMNIVERSMLRVEMTGEDGRDHEFLALNEAVLMRGETGRLVSLEARVDGELLNHYRADGLIVATPTGSTAYSMAAGGPLLGPQAGVFVITPICPHSMSNRSLVVEEDSVIEFMPSGNGDEPILFSVDGRDILRIEKNSMVRVKRHHECLRLVRLPAHSFYETLRRKLRWHGG